MTTAGLQLPGIADAYLEWALSVGFQGVADTNDHAAGQQIALLLKPKDAAMLKSLVQPGSNNVIAWCYQAQPVAVLMTSAEWVQRHLPELKAATTALELATPIAVAPSGSALSVRRTQPAELTQTSSAGSSCVPTQPDVMGCIDDGFAVDHPMFRRVDGSYRLLRYWDQNESQAPSAPWTASGFEEGGRAHLMGYGRQLTQVTGLAACGMSVPLFPPPVGGSHDDVAYHQALGLSALRHPSTHGMHVLDALAGSVPVLNRCSPSRPGTLAQPGHDGKRPTQAPVADRAADASLVLVQLPQRAKDDASGRWLGSHVLDGIHYILAAAGQATHVVINVSWGPQTGPHDGSSLLELAMDALVEQWREKGRKLDIVLPAGNTSLAQAHAEFDICKGLEKGVYWVVPPGQTSTSFLEIWWPASMASAPAVAITSPSGHSIAIHQEGIGTVSHASVVLIKHHSGRYMALVAMPPTFSHGHSVTCAPHGRWRVSVKASSAGAGGDEASIYLGRTRPNMGGRPRGTSGYLLAIDDDGSHRQQHTPASRYASKPPLVTQGALNGIATGRATHVVGGLQLTDGEAVRYGSGPLPASPRGVSLPAQESTILHGMLTGAVRPGTVARLVGTSIAAPQEARRLVNAGFTTNPPATNVPKPTAAFPV